MMKALKLVKLKITSGVCGCLFLTFAFISPHVDAATTGSEYRELGLLYRQQGRYTQAIDAMRYPTFSRFVGFRSSNASRLQRETKSAALGTQPTWVKVFGAN